MCLSLEGRCTGYFSWCCDLTRISREEGFIWDHSGDGMWQEIAYIYLGSSGSRGRRLLVFSSVFLFIQPRTPAHGMVPATFRVSLLSETSLGAPSQTCPLRAPSQTCPQVCSLGESEFSTVDNRGSVPPHPPLPSLRGKGWRCVLISLHRSLTICVRAKWVWQPQEQPKRQRLMKEKAEKVSPSLMIVLSFPTHHLKIIVHLSDLCGWRFRENLDVCVAGTIGPSLSVIPICASQADPYGGYFRRSRVGNRDWKEREARVLPLCFFPALACLW